MPEWERAEVRSLDRLPLDDLTIGFPEPSEASPFTAAHDAVIRTRLRACACIIGRDTR